MFKKQMRSVIMFLLIAVLVVPFFATPVSATYENTYSNTGNMRDDIIGVALTQVGYSEGSNNYTKYGVWYGQPNSPWCGMFVSWCANQAGIPTSILKRTGIASPSSFGLSYQSGNNYTPQKGDLFFKKGFSHVGLVYYTEGDYFYTVEGNTSTTGYEGTSVMIRKRKTSDFYFSSPNYSGSSNSGCSHNYETKIEAEHPHKEFKTCTKCGNKTYTGNSITTENCKTCVQEACDHNFNTWKNVDNNNHSRVCSKCDLSQTKSHDWKVGEVTKEATCVDKGIQKITCTDCGAESSKSIDATGIHNYTDFSYIDETEHQKVCSVCNEQTTSEHTLSNDWKHDSLYHWTSCEDCNGRIRHQEHTFPNGCLEPCYDCGYVMTSGHKGNGEKHSSESYHWELCIRCGQETAKTTHNYSSDCDEYCNDCNFKRKITGKHNDVLHANASGHWCECASCARTTEITEHIADKNAEEWDALLCVHCNFELRSADRHIHEFTQVQHDATTHWGSCVCGALMEAEVHSWDIKTGTCCVCQVSNIPEETSGFGNFLIGLFSNLFK